MTNNFQKIENRSRLAGSGGSITLVAVLFLLLFFTYLPEIERYSEEVIMVSFGDSFDGGGTGGDYGGSAGGTANEGGYATQQITEQPIAQSPVQSISPDNTLLTQDDPSDAYTQQQTAVDAARQKAIADAEAAHIAEQQRQQAAIDRANRLGSALAGSRQSAQGTGTGFGTGTGTGNASGDGAGNGTGTGDGVGTGNGNGRQGNPAGRGIPNGSWSLRGRELVATSVPNYPSNYEGKITVDITVNELGTVTGTSIGKPTTISDPAMQRAAIAAAKKARFSNGAGTVRGTITYEYKYSNL